MRWVLASLLCLAVPAVTSAHVDMLEPPSRYGPDVLKYGPCGMFGDNPRTEDVTVFEPGATITVQFDEYIDHPSHYRVSFDDDGHDDFVDPACTSGCDTTSPTIERYSNDAVLLDGIEDGSGGRRSVTVTLPDVECETCTLQLIQVMYDKPPYEIGGNDIYYQCADLALRAGPEADAGPRDDAGPGDDAGAPRDASGSDRDGGMYRGDGGCSAASAGDGGARSALPAALAVLIGLGLGRLSRLRGRRPRSRCRVRQPRARAPPEWPRPAAADAREASPRSARLRARR